jgi:hypothetical protein
MKATRKRKGPEIVLREGKSTAVMQDFQDSMKR